MIFKEVIVLLDFFSSTSIGIGEGETFVFVSKITLLFLQFISIFYLNLIS